MKPLSRNLQDLKSAKARPEGASRHRGLGTIAIQCLFFAIFPLNSFAYLSTSAAVSEFQQSPEPPVTTATPTQQPQVEPAIPADTALSQAWSLLREGKANEAELIVRKYIAEHPHSAEGHFFLGYVLFKKIQADAVQNAVVQNGVSEGNLKSREDNAKASLGEYSEGARYHDPSAFDLKVVALDYVLLKDYPDADKWLTKSVQRNASDSEAWYYLGRTKYKENRFEEAIAAFQQFLKLEPHSVKGEDNLGLAYQGLGHTDDAIAAYKQAIAWQAGKFNADSDPFINLGAILLDQNQAREAVSYLVQAVTISPQDFRAHEQLGKAYERLEELAKAQGELEKAVQLAPENARLHYILGQVYRKQGLNDRAKSEFDRSSALRANSRSVDQ